MAQDNAIRISVVVPCFNLGPYAGEAVRSVFESTGCEPEVVFVDDGSTDPVPADALLELARQFGAVDRFQFVRQENQGVSVARNTGIRRARGRYILPLDADDRVRPDYLARAAAVLDRDPGIGIVYANVQRFGLEDGVWEFRDFSPVNLLVENRVPACAVFRRSVWESCGGFDPLVSTHEDWEFWIQAMGHGFRFHLLDGIGAEYRARANSKVRTWDRPELRRRILQHICRKHAALFAQHLTEFVPEKEMQVLERDTHIAELMGVLAETRAQLDRTVEGVLVQEVVIKRMIREAEDREAELGRIRGSRAWRLLNRLGLV